MLSLVPLLGVAALVPRVRAYVVVTVPLLATITVALVVNRYRERYG
jgi:hypothetical protein